MRASQGLQIQHSTDLIYTSVTYMSCPGPEHITHTTLTYQIHTHSTGFYTQVIHMPYTVSCTSHTPYTNHSSVLTHACHTHVTQLLTHYTHTSYILSTHSTYMSYSRYHMNTQHRPYTYLWCSHTAHTYRLPHITL